MVPWPLRQAQLDNLQHWALQGSILIKHQRQSWHARLHWQQQGQGRYQINVFSPLGAGVGRLQGTPEQSVFTTAQGEVHRAKSAEALLMRELGWQLPLAGLQSWLKGVPAQNLAVSALTRDRYQRLDALQQQGWRIDYQRYSQVQGMQLPSQLLMRRQDWEIRTVVTAWIIGNKQLT